MASWVGVVFWKQVRSIHLAKRDVDVGMGVGVDVM